MPYLNTNVAAQLSGYQQTSGNQHTRHVMLLGTDSVILNPIVARRPLGPSFNELLRLSDHFYGSATNSFGMNHGLAHLFGLSREGRYSPLLY
jgi:hypothetical protein